MAVIVRVSVDVFPGVMVPVGVADLVKVEVAVFVDEGEAVRVGLGVPVAVNVMVITGVAVLVYVDEHVTVGDAVRVCVYEAEGDTVALREKVGVKEYVIVGLGGGDGEFVREALMLGVGVKLRVGVGVGGMVRVRVGVYMSSTGI